MGCIVLYVAVVAGTYSGVSVIPFLPYIAPPGFARAYAVIGINLVVIVLVAFIFGFIVKIRPVGYPKV